MKQQLRTRAALMSLALAACGGNNNATTNANTTTTTTTTSGNERSQTVVAPDDVSEVAAPNELFALIRATSVRAVAARIARYGFLTESDATGKATELLSQLLGNEALARLVRTERPMDGAVVFGGGRTSFVSSFAVPIPSETVRRLGNGFRSRSVGNGVIELTPQVDEQQSGPRDPEQDSSGDEFVCFVSPTPSPSEGRLTCTTEARSALETVTPFLARTLTRRETRQDAIVATVFPNAVRAMMGADITRELDQADRGIDSELGNSTRRPLNHADVRTPLVRMLHDAMANVRALWSETQGLDLAISFDDQRVRLSGSIDVRNPSGSAARALIEGTRSAPALPEQFLQRIPTDAGFIMTGSFSHQIWAPFARPFTDITVALARNEARLPAAMVTDLQTVLTHMFEQDTSVAVGVYGDSANHLNSVGVIRLADEAHATQLVGDYRRAITILRNPTFTRAIETFLREIDAPPMRVDWRQIRELPTRGLPAGAFAYQMPNFRALAQQARTGVAPTGRNARTPAAAPLQYLVVPEGGYVTVVHAPDVRAAWTQISARAGAPLDLALHGARTGTFTTSIVPAGVAGLMAASGEAESVRMAGNVRTVVSRMPDRGTTPAILRMTNAEVDGNQRFSMEIEVQVSTLTGLAAAMR